jgi:regulatory protein
MFHQRARSQSKDTKPVSIKSCALKLLTYRARSESELINRLCLKGFDEAEAQKTAQYLKEIGLINDNELAGSLLRYCTESRIMGKASCRAYMRKRGVPEELVREIEFTNDQELEKAKRLVEKKKSILKGYDSNKLYRFLQRRGFSPEVILKLMRTELNSEDML